MRTGYGKREVLTPLSPPLLCGLKTIVVIRFNPAFRSCSAKLFCDVYIAIVCIVNIRANIYSHLKNKFIFGPGKWRITTINLYMQVKSDLSITHSLMYTAKYKFSGENLPMHTYGASRGIYVIVTLILSIIVHNKAAYCKLI